MIEAHAFLDALDEQGLGPFLGVPCSFLGPLIDATIASPRHRYLAANNEGEAVAMAAGAYLAGQRPVVMFQNSGLGNAINPLTSLTFPFRIPLLLITTQRGEPGLADEPQHELMGRITEPLVRLAGLGCALFPDSPALIRPRLGAALTHMEQHGLPYALVMKKGTVRAGQPPAAAEGAPAPAYLPAPGRLLPGEPMEAPPVLRRVEAVAAVAGALPPAAALVATTGKIGRELFTVAEREGNLYMVGSMGCAASLALGVALHRPGRKVAVLDGDGAALMRLEAMVSLGHYRPENLLHVILDNRMHESTGGQATLADTADFARIAVACGYASAVSLRNGRDLEAAVQRALAEPGPHLIHLRVHPGSAPGLGRPTLRPPQVRERFMAFLARDA